MTSRSRKTLSPSKATDGDRAFVGEMAMLISLALQAGVSAGYTQWLGTDSGQLELKLETGETYLLQESAIVRLK